MKKVIFAVIFIVLLMVGVNAGWFRVSDQYGFFVPRLTANLSPQLIQYIQEQLVLIVAKIKELQGQLNELIQKEKSSPLTAVATTTAAATTVTVPILPKLIVNDLKFKVDFPILQNRNYLEFPLFSFVPETKENIAITRLRFTQVGTLNDIYLADIRLFRVAGSEVLLKKVDKPVDGVIEFNLTPDTSKPDRGLVVPGEQYRVVGVITVYYGVIRPTVSLELTAKSDVSAFDANDLSRQAELPEAIFPVGGPIYTISRD